MVITAHATVLRSHLWGVLSSTTHACAWILARPTANLGEASCDSYVLQAPYVSESNAHRPCTTAPLTLSCVCVCASVPRRYQHVWVGATDRPMDLARRGAATSGFLATADAMGLLPDDGCLNMGIAALRRRHASATREAAEQSLPDEVGEDGTVDLRHVHRLFTAPSGPLQALKTICDPVRAALVAWTVEHAHRLILTAHCVCGAGWSSTVARQRRRCRGRQCE